ncbi:hypothetical protein QJS04_geneDACA013888 [Acorus gramineus]|uniref:holo-[acyl-carrier-protein] synthase n=1 Tax=Acorus gramineus TaxID=55184 RepID=A0AAV9AVC2_ACOGR|nr:hypothetical protein QJS04_geneDACA013888 [Acorus gramineus]
MCSNDPQEAYVKALGRGFSAAPFKDFTIRFTAREDEESEIVIEALRDPENLTTNWQFTLLELESSHYAAVCVMDGDNENRPPGQISHPLKFKVWKTLPLVEDECMSGTDAVVSINGVSKHLKFSSESHH